MDNWINWAAGILTLVNSAWLIVAAWKKLKPEVKKMETDAELDILEGAAKSQQMLIDRINDLQSQLNAERDNRKSELQQEREARKLELDAEREARRRDKEYFLRKIADAEGETKAYRRWAAMLVKQIVEAGKVPAAFVPFSDDSQPGMSAIGSDQEGKK